MTEALENETAELLFGGLLDFTQEVGLHAAVPVAVKTRKGNLQSRCDS